MTDAMLRSKYGKNHSCKKGDLMADKLNNEHTAIATRIWEQLGDMSDYERANILAELIARVIETKTSPMRKITERLINDRIGNPGVTLPLNDPAEQRRDRIARGRE
jgi:hypothetical protein